MQTPIPKNTTHCKKTNQFDIFCKEEIWSFATPTITTLVMNHIKIMGKN